MDRTQSYMQSVLGAFDKTLLLDLRIFEKGYLVTVYEICINVKTNLLLIKIFNKTKHFLLLV